MDDLRLETRLLKASFIITFLISHVFERSIISNTSESEDDQRRPGRSE